MGSPDNGETISLHSEYVSSLGSELEEWTTVETVLIRVDLTTVNPEITSRFPVNSDKSPWLGYDAAVCVLKYEPWIIETYNTSITSPSALRIVGKGNGSIPMWPDGSIQGDPIADTARYLSKARTETAFWVANGMAIKRMWRGREWLTGSNLDKDYVPSATVGPVVPPHATFLLLTLPYRLFLLPMVLDHMHTPNSLQTGSPSSAHGLARLPLYHT